MNVVFCVDRNIATQSGDPARTFKQFSLIYRCKTLEMPLTQCEQDEMGVTEQGKLLERVDMTRI